MKIPFVENAFRIVLFRLDKLFRCKSSTPPKINIKPENDGLEDDFPFPGVYSQVPAVNLPGCDCLFQGPRWVFLCWSLSWVPRKIFGSKLMPMYRAMKASFWVEKLMEMAGSGILYIYILSMYIYIYVYIFHIYKKTLKLSELVTKVY